MHLLVRRDCNCSPQCCALPQAADGSAKEPENRVGSLGPSRQLRELDTNCAITPPAKDAAQGVTCGSPPKIVAKAPKRLAKENLLLPRVSVLQERPPADVPLSCLKQGPAVILLGKI